MEDDLIPCEMTELPKAREIGPYRLGRLQAFRDRYQRTGELKIPPLFLEKGNEHMLEEFTKFCKLEDNQLCPKPK